MKPLAAYGKELLPTLRDYSERGLVSLRKHPTFDLWIANYTPSVQYTRAWDDVTLQTRCIMVDKNGLVAKSFNKFFNVGEVPFEAGTYYVSDKIDGSIILATTYEGELVVASKSSFTSDHALEGTKLLDRISLPPSYGHVFELTHPSYRIVLDYGLDPTLYYLGTVEDPNDAHASFLEPKLWMFSMPNMSAFQLKDEQAAFDLVTDTIGIEGYILTSITDPHKKYKLKTPWYLERHRVIFGLNPQRIFDVAKTGNYKEFVTSLPDEFQKDIEDQIECHIGHFNEVKEHMTQLAATLMADAQSRKDYAQVVKEQPREFQSMLFAAFDNEEIPDTYIWKAIQP